jgi:branched-chain amino acid transport system permease protein
MIIDLIIAVLGGMKHPIGAFVGAIVYVLLQNFAIDLFERERFNLVIGAGSPRHRPVFPDWSARVWRSFAPAWSRHQPPARANHQGQQRGSE